MIENAATFAAVGFTLLAAHSFGDHWVQTNDQAMNKGRRDAEGRAYCRRHVYGLTATKVVALAALMIVTGVRVHPIAFVLALTVDAVSHYWCDRRFTLAKFTWSLRAIGKDGFHRAGDPKAAPCGTGAYALDQSFHHLFLFVSALIMSV